MSAMLRSTDVERLLVIFAAGPNGEVALSFLLGRTSYRADGNHGDTRDRRRARDTESIAVVSFLEPLQGRCSGIGALMLTPIRLAYGRDGSDKQDGGEKKCRVSVLCLSLMQVTCHLNRGHSTLFHAGDGDLVVDSRARSYLKTLRVNKPGYEYLHTAEESAGGIE